MMSIFNPFRKSITVFSQQLKSKLWVRILVAMVAGISTGIILSPEGLALLPKDAALTTGSWLAVPGDLFLALIQMIVIPLIICSIILGITSSDSIDNLKKVGIRVMPYFVGTTAIAVFIGVVLADTIEPGKWIDQDLVKQQLDLSGQSTEDRISNLKEGTEATLPELITRLIPTNPIASAVEQEMLQVVIFSILVGVALALMGNRKAQPLLSVCQSFLDVAMRIVGWAMKLVPYAVFGLLAEITIKIGIDVLLGTAAYVLTVLLGLAILLSFYMAIIALVGQRNPLTFLSRIKDVQLLAFSTSSSAAVMPLTIKTGEEKLKLRPSIVRFMVPLGATVNMDGTALYQAIAALFLVQVFGVDLTTGQVVLLMVTTIGASIGAPSTPGVGIIILAGIMESFGVPAASIALIIGVDRILDMSRTTVNVTGDLVASTVMHHWIGEDYEPESTTDVSDEKMAEEIT